MSNEARRRAKAWGKLEKAARNVIKTLQYESRAKGLDVAAWLPSGSNYTIQFPGRPGGESVHILLSANGNICLHPSHPDTDAEAYGGRPKLTDIASSLFEDAVRHRLQECLREYETKHEI